ncbi:MAG: hypothetical protein ACJ72Y_05505 [Actinomycetes bacterium]
MVLRPVGDLPPSVYWVRRLIVLGVLLLVFALVWWVWPSGGDDAGPTSSEPTTTPTVSSTPLTSSPAPSTSETKKDKTKSNKPSCKDSDVEVKVSTDADSYPPDEDPAITFSVENISDKTCSRDIGQAANELQITSGGSQVWSSDDCNPGGEVAVDNLRPGDRFVQTVTWPRIQSAEGCPTPEQDAAPGTYQVIARNGEVLSEPAVFSLE